MTVVFMLVYLALITGALHEDALGDAADGFGGGWDKDQVLTIMRDSRIGSYGAIAISLSLLARFVLLTELAPDKVRRVFRCSASAQPMDGAPAFLLACLRPVLSQDKDAWSQGKSPGSPYSLGRFSPRPLPPRS